MRIKMDQIHANAEAGKSPVRTTITEPEVNGFLVFDSKSIPKGVEQPSITMMGGGRLTAQAMVNLDDVSAESSGGMLNPMRLLTGRLPVSTTGTLRSGAGSARYELESAEVSGITVPKSVLAAGPELLLDESRESKRPQPRRAVPSARTDRPRGDQQGRDGRRPVAGFVSTASRAVGDA